MQLISSPRSHDLGNAAVRRARATPCRAGRRRGLAIALSRRPLHQSITQAVVGGGCEDIWEPEEDIYWGSETQWLEDKRYTGERDLTATF